MKTRRIVMIALAALVAMSAVGVASAQPPEQRRDGPRGRGGRHPIIRGLHHVASAITEATGLEHSDIVAQLADGKTLAEIIAENGGDTDAVKAELLAPLQERVAAAVEAGHITQERADEFLASANERLETLLNRVFERLPEIYERRQERRNPRDNKI